MSDPINPNVTLLTHGAHPARHGTAEQPVAPQAANQEETSVKPTDPDIPPSVNEPVTNDPDPLPKQVDSKIKTNNQAQEPTNQPNLPDELVQTNDHEPALHQTLDMPIPKAIAASVPISPDPNYDIIQVLGKGGMGIVYLARQKSIGRTVALKKIIDKSDGDTYRLRATLRRFQTEAEVLGRLQHPNIIQVYDYGTSEDGMPFFALEFCKGGDLYDALKNRQVEPRQAARLMLVLARAMNAAHKAGIVHRDLKPQNVLLTEPCDDINTLNPTHLKIADFGLARNTDVIDKPRETQVDQAMGTWLYMAPEQAKNAAEAGPSADIYALGVILYEMLTGRLPLVSNKKAEMERLLAEVDPQPIAVFSRNCPADLETICLKCLRKNSRNRYRTADAFAEDLQAFLEVRPISARPVGQVEKAWMWMLRNPGKSIATGASLLLGILIVLGSIVVAREKIHSANMKLEDERKLQEQALSNEKQLRENDLRAEQDKTRLQIMSLFDRLTSPNTAPEGIGDIISQIDTLAIKVKPVVLDSESRETKILPWGHLLNWNSYDLREYLVQSTPLARARIKLAMLPRHPDFVSDVAKDAITRPAGEMLVYTSRLKSFAPALTQSYWQQLLDPAQPLPDRLRLGVILATWNPSDARWARAARAVTESLVELDVLELNPWLKLIEPIRAQLFDPLEEFFLAGAADHPSEIVVSRGETAARIIAALGDNHELLAMAASRATDRQFEILASRLKQSPTTLHNALDRITRQTSGSNLLGDFLTSLVPLELEPPAANTRNRITQFEAHIRTISRAICCLAFLGKPERLWQALERDDLPGLQAELRHTVVPYRVPLATVVSRYSVEQRPGVKRNIILLMGAYNETDLTKVCDSTVLQILLNDFKNHPDPGVHAALDWFLRMRLKKPAELDLIVQSLAKKIPAQATQSGWRVNIHGQTLTMIPPGKSFMMGSGPDDPDRMIQLGHDIESRHKVAINHGFEIGQREVTVKEFKKFKKDYVSLSQVGSAQAELHDSEPAIGISWFDAMAYCHWLNTNKNPDKGFELLTSFVDDSAMIGSNMKMSTSFLKMPGYRLPTEEEWELAARAGINAPYPCGHGVKWLGDHAVTWSNANDRIRPSGCHFPNAWGLSDTSGNALEWVMDDFRRYKDPAVSIDQKDNLRLQFMVISADSLRVVRGGSYSNGPTAARNSARLMARADQRAASSGFRICRTTFIPADSKNQK